jgi:glycosyltransferase involved in cell wall biosynthesis
MVAFEQASRLVRRGHRVTALTSRMPGDPVREEDGGLLVERIDALNVLEKRGVPYPLFSPALAPRAFALARKADVVLAHSHTFLTSAAAVLAARAAGKPSLVLQHNTLIDYPQPLRALEHLADHTLGALTLRMAERRFAVSKESCRYVERLSGRPCHLLANGVDTARFHPVADRGPLRDSFGLPRGKIIALTVRRLSFKNGIDTLLEVARLRTDMHFAVAGSGPDRGALDRYVEEHGLTNVAALGFVTDERLPELYQACDLFVLPSRSGEGMPLVILEAFASALPCIATRSGGQVELIEEGATGWLVPPGDPHAIAAALSEGACEPKRLGAMGASARARAERVDWERQVTLLEEHLFEATR